jgi:hypothetical protein
MSFDDETAELLKDLAGSDPDMRVIALQDLARYPSRISEVIAAVRQLIEDRTPAVISIPYVFGEVRWVAAYALAAELKAQGIRESVSIQDIPKPIGINGLGPLEQQAGTGSGGLDGSRRSYAELRDRGFLKTTSLTLNPPGSAE